jgi:LEA14-like dessication related protein
MDAAGLVTTLALVGVGVGSVGLVATLLSTAFQRPSVEIDDVGTWHPLADRRIDVLTTVRVTGVSPLLAAVSDRLRVEYYIELNGVRLATGQREGLELEAGDQLLQLRSSIEHENVPALWATFVESDESITVTTGGELTFGPWGLLTLPVPSVERQVLDGETPVVDALSSAADGLADDYSLDTGSIVSQLTDGLLRLGSASPAVGYEIDRGWATWGEVSAEETTVLFHFEVTNRGDVPMPSVPEALDVTLEMNDIALFRARTTGATLLDATSEPPLAPGESRRVEYPVRMDNGKVDAWFRSHVRNGERTDLTASVRLVYRPMLLNAAFTIPPDSVPTVTCDVQTGILLDQETKTTCDGPVGGPR